MCLREPFLHPLPVPLQRKVAFLAENLDNMSLLINCDILHPNLPDGSWADSCEKRDLPSDSTSPILHFSISSDASLSTWFCLQWADFCAHHWSYVSYHWSSTGFLWIRPWDDVLHYPANQKCQKPAKIGDYLKEDPSNAQTICSSPYHSNDRTPYHVRLPDPFQFSVSYFRISWSGNLQCLRYHCHCSWPNVYTCHDHGASTLSVGSDKIDKGVWREEEQNESDRIISGSC